MSQPLFRKSALAVAMLSLGLAVGAGAQSTAPQSPPAKASTTAPPASGSTGTDKGAGTATSRVDASKAAISGAERRFLESAARDGMAEIELGKLAQQKGESQSVKDFGKRMVDDHGKAGDELKQIASSKNVTLPSELDDRHKRTVERLSKKSGAEFDRDYMDAMVDDHEKAVRDFRSMTKSAKDAEVKAFASSTLPVLEQHLALARTGEDALQSARRGGKTSRTAGAKSGGDTMPGTTTGTPTGTATGTSGSGDPSRTTASPHRAGAASGTGNGELKNSSAMASPAQKP